MLEKLISIWAKEKAHLSIWTLNMFLLGSIWSLSSADLADLTTTLRVGAGLLCKLALSLLCLLLSLLASLLVLLKKPNVKHYEQINPPGFYKHKKNGGYYCQKCLLKDKIAVSLSPVSKEEYLCRVCKEPYKIDYQVLLCDSYMSKAYRDSKVFEDHNKAVHEFCLKDDDKAS